MRSVTRGGVPQARHSFTTYGSKEEVHGAIKIKCRGIKDRHIIPPSSQFRFQNRIFFCAGEAPALFATFRCTYGKKNRAKYKYSDKEKCNPDDVTDGEVLLHFLIRFECRVIQKTRGTQRRFHFLL